MILTITIPTYNRLEMLEKNVRMLCYYIEKNSFKEHVQILISDNASEDNVEKKIKDISTEYSDISIIYHRNRVNIGFIKNIIYMLRNCHTEYFMLLGDDDYLDENYLNRVVDILKKEKKVSCIIPSYYNVDLLGNSIGRGRDLEKKSKKYNAGFINCFFNSWRGHQMSGLVVKNDDMFEKLVQKRINNYYPQIYMVAYSCMTGVTYHITEYPLKVTRPPQNQKTWQYGECGLITDIFNVYKKLDNINYFQRFCLEFKILCAQYWRIAMYLKKGRLSIFKCIYSIAINKNTTNLMSVLIWVLVPFIFAGKGISLLVTGKLARTLSTKVDI